MAKNILLDYNPRLTTAMRDPIMADPKLAQVRIMELTQAFRHGLDGQAILFVGAGYSAAARNGRGLNLPTGSDLTDLLANALGAEQSNSLSYVADRYAQEKGEFKLIELLRDRFTATQITPSQAIFGSIPWRRVYTTNYDNVLELAYRESKQRIDSLTLTNVPGDIAASTPVCLHINGYIEKLDHQNLGTSFIVTDTSYFSDTFNKSRWSRLFREDMEIARAIIFVGYRLSDIDIARVLYASPEIRQKCCFVVSEKPSEQTRFTLSRFGSVHAVGVEAAGRLLSEISATHVSVPATHAFFSFHNRKLNIDPGRIISDRDVFDLYVLGRLDWGLLRQLSP